jgi:hypothetical protein
LLDQIIGFVLLHLHLLFLNSMHNPVKVGIKFCNFNNAWNQIISLILSYLHWNTIKFIKIQRFTHGKTLCIAIQEVNTFLVFQSKLTYTCYICRKSKASVGVWNNKFQQYLAIFYSPSSINKKYEKRHVFWFSTL